MHGRGLVVVTYCIPDIMYALYVLYDGMKRKKKLNRVFYHSWSPFEKTACAINVA